MLSITLKMHILIVDERANHPRRHYCSTFYCIPDFISSLQVALFCRISVTFVDKDGEEKHIKVPIGMSMLEAAHENDIELEGKDSDAYKRTWHFGRVTEC